jgi:hypothetical protein
MTVKEDLIARQKEKLWAASIFLILSLVLLACGLIIREQAVKKGDLVMLMASFGGSAASLLVFGAIVCEWFYCKGLLVYMPDRAPRLPSKLPSNVFLLRGRRKREDEPLN